MMALTMPQIIMYNHASWVNHKRHESKSEKKDPAPKKAESPEPGLLDNNGNLLVDTSTYMKYWMTNPVGG